MSKRLVLLIEELCKVCHLSYPVEFGIKYSAWIKQNCARIQRALARAICEVMARVRLRQASNGKMSADHRVFQLTALSFVCMQIFAKSGNLPIHLEILKEHWHTSKTLILCVLTQVKQISVHYDVSLESLFWLYL